MRYLASGHLLELRQKCLQTVSAIVGLQLEERSCHPRLRKAGDWSTAPYEYDIAEVDVGWGLWSDATEACVPWACWKKLEPTRLSWRRTAFPSSEPTEQISTAQSNDPKAAHGMDPQPVTLAVHSLCIAKAGHILQVELGVSTQMRQGPNWTRRSHVA